MLELQNTDDSRQTPATTTTITTTNTTTTTTTSYIGIAKPIQLYRKVSSVNVVTYRIRSRIMSADDKAYYRGKIDEELSKRHPNEKKIKLWDDHLFALEGVSGKSQNISLSLPACLFPFLSVVLI